MSFYKQTIFQNKLNPEKILAFLGVGKKQDFSHSLGVCRDDALSESGTVKESGKQKESIQKIFQILKEYEEPFYRKIDPVALFSEGTLKIKGREIPVIGCIASLGEEASGWISSLFSRDEILAGMVMDAAMDVYLFDMQKEFSEPLLFLCREGGYGIRRRLKVPENLPFEVQRQIHEMTDAGKHHISINENFVLSPAKSLSIIYELGKEGECQTGHTCTGCQSKYCILRKKRGGI